MIDDDVPEDETPEETPEQVRARWEAQLQSGVPLMEHVISPPFKIALQPNGSLILDAPSFALAGFSAAGVVRFVFTPDALVALRHAMSSSETTNSFSPPIN